MPATSACSSTIGAPAGSTGTDGPDAVVHAVRSSSESPPFPPRSRWPWSVTGMTVHSSVAGRPGRDRRDELTDAGVGVFDEAAVLRTDADPVAGLVHPAETSEDQPVVDPVLRSEERYRRVGHRLVDLLPLVVAVRRRPIGTPAAAGDQRTAGVGGHQRQPAGRDECRQLRALPTGELDHVGMLIEVMG